MLKALWADDSGQGLVKYALIIALVAVGLIAILLVLRTHRERVQERSFAAEQRPVGAVHALKLPPWWGRLSSRPAEPCINVKHA